MGMAGQKMPNILDSIRTHTVPTMERNADDDVNDVVANDSKPSTTSMTTTATTSRISFGSCHKSLKSSTPPIWETILPPVASSTDNTNTNTNTEQQHDNTYLDGWLWLGDAMYPNHRDPITNKKYYGPAPPNEIEIGLHEMKYINATIGYKDFLHRLVNQENKNKHQYQDRDKNQHNQLSQLPIVGGVWDDHDYGGNDMGSKMPNKKERQTIYRDFLSLDHSTSTSKKKNDKELNIQDRDGMYRRIDFENGKIRFLVLDTRWHREDHCIPSLVRSDANTACFVMLSIPMLIKGCSACRTFSHILFFLFNF